MKHLSALALFSLLALPVHAGTMARVGRVLDSRTIVLDGGTTVTLRGVEIPPEQESLACDYLRSLLANNVWVLVENGDLYRSPDALYINGQLITRAYLLGPRVTYLGESMPGTHARTTAPLRPAPARVAPPPRRSRRRAAPQRPAPPPRRTGFAPRKGGV